MPSYNTYEYLQENISVFWNFLKEKYPVHKNSNVFFRDIQFAIKDYFAKKDRILNYAETEQLAEKITQLLEQKGILKKLNNNTWKVNFLEDQLVNADNTNLKEAN